MLFLIYFKVDVKDSYFKFDVEDFISIKIKVKMPRQAFGLVDKENKEGRRMRRKLINSQIRLASLAEG